MTEQPEKRSWFQLHLSTCVALMFVAGPLVWANYSYYMNLDWILRHFNLYEASFDLFLLGCSGLPVLSIVVLSGIAVTAEFLLRRRERKRAAQPKPGKRCESAIVQR